MLFSNRFRSLQRPESGEIKLLNRSHGIVGILTIHADKQQKMKQGTFLIFSCHWSLDSLPTRFLRRTGHIMNKVHEFGT